MQICTDLQQTPRIQACWLVGAGHTCLGAYAPREFLARADLPLSNALVRATSIMFCI